MANIEIYRTCERCNGTGEIVHGTGTITCPACSGATKMFFADSDELTTQLSDMADRLDDIMDKCNDIFEAVS